LKLKIDENLPTTVRFSYGYFHAVRVFTPSGLLPSSSRPPKILILITIEIGEKIEVSRERDASWLRRIARNTGVSLLCCR